MDDDELSPQIQKVRSASFYQLPFSAMENIGDDVFDEDNFDENDDDNTDNDGSSLKNAFSSAPALGDHKAVCKLDRELFREQSFDDLNQLCPVDSAASLTTGHASHVLPNKSVLFSQRSAEHKRLVDSYNRKADWKNWGPYLSERAWGTVREDYSENGNAWDSVPHDASRSRAYRWNEDGIGGLCNRHQNICLSVALWNGKDPILKERLFGLTGPQGNHGEDVKELYYYVDSTPSHSYMKMIYKYPIQEFPYSRLVDENGARSRTDPEFELLDAIPNMITEHFDVTIEYAKASQNDILCKITAKNCSPTTTAPITILPHVWARNTWSWGYNDERPTIRALSENCVEVFERHISTYHWFVEDDNHDAPQDLLFTENDTNNQRLFGSPNATPYVKDAFHEYVVNKKRDAVNPQGQGTKCAAVFQRVLSPGESCTVRVRFKVGKSKPKADMFSGFDAIMKSRQNDADEFYSMVHAPGLSSHIKAIQRQAIAGLLWSKQFYHYGVDMWLTGDPACPVPPESRFQGRNADWKHLYNSDVISMPDKWEYPWYAAWDLAFHCIPIAMVDPEWAKRQLTLVLREWYMHPSGQIPAYEWNFSDVNPPVHAWAVLRVYQLEAANTGVHDLDFLEKCFHKLLINFTWWVNKKDQQGRNLFEGGFLGLDNIGVFDRSNLPPGKRLEQADGTAWMGMYCLNMLSIALELARSRPAYEDVATKFFEHFLAIARSITNMGGVVESGLWDEETGFFYDLMRDEATGHQHHVKVRSFVGLIPLFAVAVIPEELLDKLPNFKRRMEWTTTYRSDSIANYKLLVRSCNGYRLLTLCSEDHLQRVLTRLLDPNQFLSDYGLRSLSKEHEANPYVHYSDGETFTVKYDPAESSSSMFGGNSNWRGPIWFPVNVLMIESLQIYGYYFKTTLRVPFPTGSDNMLTLDEVSVELSKRLLKIFAPNEKGKRPVNGQYDELNTHAQWRDLITFYEYFHGDNGTGLGASHQTGWTGLAAYLCQLDDTPDK